MPSTKSKQAVKTAKRASKASTSVSSAQRLSKVVNEDKVAKSATKASRKEKPALAANRPKQTDKSAPKKKTSSAAVVPSRKTSTPVQVRNTKTRQPRRRQSEKLTQTDGAATPAQSGLQLSAGISELISGLVGRSAYAASSYQTPKRLGDQRTVDMCAGCAVDCCSEHILPLSVVDAWAIQRTLQLPWTSFCGLVPLMAGSPTWRIRLDTGYFQLVLRRRRRSCVFLMRFGRQRRCGIHALRPIACQLFPAMSGEQAQNNAPVGMIAQRPPRDCPWLWPADEGAKKRVADLIGKDVENRAIDRDVLSIWHWQLNLQRTPQNFFRYLDQEMSRRERKEPGPSPWRTSLW